MHPSSPGSRSEDLTLVAADGTRLAATHHRARGGHGRWLVVGSATAVPRGFYRRFAEFAAHEGWHVLTLDYRGIGGSAPRRLRGFAPDYLDWARQDLAAAVEHAAARGDAALAGHSYGGHAIGLLPNHRRLRAAYVCAVGAGWHGWMPRAEQRRVWIMWNLIGPLATLTLGYQPMKALGIGENLPVSIYRQWKRWCSFPDYFFGDPAMKGRLAGFAEVTLPIATANTTDDTWALPASRDAFMAGYTAAPQERFVFTPGQLGGPVGHMGYFRPGPGARLWPQMLQWLGRAGRGPAAHIPP